MLRPPARETLAVLDATMDELARLAPAVLLGMWHHLADHDERTLLLLPFDAGGRPSSLIEAMVATVRSDDWRAFLATPSVLAGPVISRHPAMGEALRRALRDVFADRLPAMVTEAWVTTLELTLARTRPDAAHGGGKGR